MRRRRLLPLLLVCLSACGDDGDDDAVDAGPDGNAPDAGAPEVEPPAAPAPAAAPSLTPCPAGWGEQADADVVTCAPWPDPAPTCAGATVVLPGRSVCEPLGAPCPAGDFADDLPDQGTIHHVRPGAVDGDGSALQPFGTVAEALSVARRGDVVALSRGDHVASLRIPGGVTVWGACADETRIVAPDVGEVRPIVTARGSGAVLRDVTVTGGRPGVRVDVAGTDLALEAVRVQDVVAAGLAAWRGARLTGQRVLVQGVAADALGTFGRGLDAEAGGSIALGEIVVEDVHDIGAFVSDDGSSLSLADGVLRRAASNPADGTLGRGLEASFGASASLQRVVIEDVHEAGVYVAYGATLTVEDLVVRRVASADDGTPGRGAEVATGATLDGRRVVFESFEDDGIFVGGGSRLTLRDTVVRRAVAGAAVGALGRGVEVQLGSRALLERVVVSETREVALQIGESGSEIEVVDVVLRAITPRESDGIYGWGVSVRDGARLFGQRLRIEDCREAGIAAEASEVELSDLVVRRIAGRSTDGAYGRAVTAQDGAHVVLTRAEMTDQQEVALFGTGAETRLELDDLVVSDTASSLRGPGRAIAAQDGAAIVGHRVRCERNREIALFAAGAGSSLGLQDIEVLDVLQRECAGCEDFGAGIGPGAYLGAALELRAFRIVGAALAGVQLARDGAMDLHDGEVSGSPIGANVQVDDYDLSRLSDRVVWRDNDRNFDGERLPTPSADLPR